MRAKLRYGSRQFNPQCGPSIISTGKFNFVASLPCSGGVLLLCNFRPYLLGKQEKKKRRDGKETRQERPGGREQEDREKGGESFRNVALLPLQVRSCYRDTGAIAIRVPHFGKIIARRSCKLFFPARAKSLGLPRLCRCHPLMFSFG